MTAGGRRLAGRSPLPRGSTCALSEIKSSRYLWGLFLAALGWIILVEAVGWAASGSDALVFSAARTIDLTVLILFASVVVVKVRGWHLLMPIFFGIGPVDWRAVAEPRLGINHNQAADRLTFGFRPLTLAIPQRHVRHCSP